MITTLTIIGAIGAAAGAGAGCGINHHRHNRVTIPAQQQQSQQQQQTRIKRSCPDCGSAVDSDASFCPSCGYDLSAAGGCSCGAINPPGAIYCIGCGKKLQEEPNQTVKFCPHCGKPVKSGATFCQYCGEDIITAAQAAQQAQQIATVLVQFVPIPSKPADWETNWESGYKNVIYKNNKLGVKIPVTNKNAPAWQDGAFFVKQAQTP
jgi:predicted RNA-binding Zn-ribbon protein involved in translation (DUF1610 family)